MFIQITKDKTARLKDITGIFDLDTSTVSVVTKNFLSKAEKNGRITGTNTLPKSFVVAGGKIYFSPGTTGRVSRAGF